MFAVLNQTQCHMSKLRSEGEGHTVLISVLNWSEIQETAKFTIAAVSNCMGAKCSRQLVWTWRKLYSPCVNSVRTPGLWSSGQSSWLQIRRPEFDSRHYQKKKVVGLERSPLSLVSTTEELLDRKVAAPVYKIENTVGGIRHADHVAPSISKSWQSLRRQAAVARSV
jgi:hypothetical protein